MRRLVLDASVIVKWLVGDPRREHDSDHAADLLAEVQRNSVELVQPPHWLAEVAGVLARLSPGTADDDVVDLVDLELEVLSSPAVYRSAVRLAIDLDQHLFDTLYHAVALDLPDAVLVTADDRYHRKARHLGSISRLRDWKSPAG